MVKFPVDCYKGSKSFDKVIDMLNLGSVAMFGENAAGILNID